MYGREILGIDIYNLEASISLLIAVRDRAKEDEKRCRKRGFYYGPPPWKEWKRSKCREILKSFCFVLKNAIQLKKDWCEIEE